MSVKKESINNTIWYSVRTGAVSVGIAMLLLLLASFLIWKGTVGEDSVTVLTAGCAALAGFIAGLLQGKKKDQALLSIVIAAVLAFFLLLLLSAGIRGGRIRIAGLLPNVAAITAGIGIAGIMQNNKTDRKRKKRK